MEVWHRIVASLITLLGVSVVTFVLAFVLPADPARTIAGPKADAVTVAAIRAEIGLDRPLPQQYLAYLGRLARGDLGRSYLTRQAVAEAIVERLPATASLAVLAMLIAVSGGLAVGSLTAFHAGRPVDVAALVIGLAVLSMPVFWVGFLLLYAFAYRIRLLPLGGYGGFSHAILPACTLALGLGAYYARLVHGSLVVVLAQDYVRTARAKGLGNVAIFLRHALRNALLPVVTVMGMDFAALMSGVVLTETVFNWPGLGRLAVEAVFNQDVPMIMGTVLVGALLVVAANVLVDVLYPWIDPRIREQSGEGAARPR